MKYIARCALEGNDCALGKEWGCSCKIPHDLDEDCNSAYYQQGCTCVPVPLSYYMKEVLKGDEKNGKKTS